MTSGPRLAAYAVVLGLALGGGALLGAAVGPEPDDTTPARSHDTHTTTTTQHGAGHGGDEGGDE